MSVNHLITYIPYCLCSDGHVDLTDLINDYRWLKCSTASACRQLRHSTRLRNDLSTYDLSSSSTAVNWYCRNSATVFSSSLFQMLITVDMLA